MSGSPTEKRWLLYSTLTVGVVFAVLFCALAIWAGQDGNWDLYNYHYYNAYAFLNDRYWFDIQPAQRQTFFSPFLDIPFYWLSEHFGILAASLGYATFQSLQAPAVFLLCWLLLDRVGMGRKATIAVAVALTFIAVMTPQNYQQIGTTRGDSTTVALLAWAIAVYFLALTRVLRLKEWRASYLLLALSGGLTGLAVGLKLTNGPYLLALLCVLLFLPVPGPAKVRLLIATGCSALAGLLVAYGYWGWFLFDQLQNPVFPQFNHIFQSEFIKPVPFTDDRFKPTSWPEWFFYPLYFNVFTGEINGQRFLDLRLPVAYLLAVSALIALVTSRSMRLRFSQMQPGSGLLLYFFAAYVLWLWLFSITRYALLLEVLAPLTALVAVRLLAGRGVTARMLQVLAVVPMAVSAVMINGGDQPFGARTPWTDSAFDVVWPAVDLDGAMVLVSGGQAASFLIPGAPENTRFVRIEGNLFYVGFRSLEERYDNEMGKRIRVAIRDHRGPFYSLYSNGEATRTDSELAVFGLRRQAGFCQPVTSKGGPPLTLCPARRAGPGDS